MNEIYKFSPKSLSSENSYILPPWNILENPEKTEGWLDFQKMMKKEMKVLPNGNYELVISPIQHECISKDFIWHCVEYSCKLGELILKLKDGDPYEDVYYTELQVKYCPFCGYKSNKLK